MIGTCFLLLLLSRRIQLPSKFSWPDVRLYACHDPPPPLAWYSTRRFADYSARQDKTLDYGNYNSYKAPVKSSPPTNQHPVQLPLVPIWVTGSGRKGIRSKLLRVPVKVLPILVGASKPWNKGVNGVKNSDELIQHRLVEVCCFLQRDRPQSKESTRCQVGNCAHIKMLKFQYTVCQKLSKIGSKLFRLWKVK